jgi:hypothetical protein
MILVNILKILKKPGTLVTCAADAREQDVAIHNNTPLLKPVR